MRSHSFNVTKGCCTVPTGTEVGSFLNAPNSGVCTISFISGMSGSLCQNYISVNDLEESLQIHVTLALASRVGKWSDQIMLMQV